MARGADAKLRRRNKRKNENEEVTNMFEVNSDHESDDNNDSGGAEGEAKKEKKTKEKSAQNLNVPVLAPKVLGKALQVRYWELPGTFFH